MTTSTAKARALIAWFADLRDATDLLAASLRTPLHRMTLSLIALQVSFGAAKAAGMLDSILAAHPHFAHAVDSVGVWVGAGSAFIALYTQRKGEARALLESKRRETSGNFSAVTQPSNERKDP